MILGPQTAEPGEKGLILCACVIITTNLRQELGDINLRSFRSSANNVMNDFLTLILNLQTYIIYALVIVINGRFAVFFFLLGFSNITGNGSGNVRTEIFVISF